MDTLKPIIRYVIFVGGVALYVFFYYTFLRDILDANGAPADLDNSAVQIASGIGGLLAATFAVAFGIQRQDRTVNEKKLNLGKTLTPDAEVVTAVCVGVYFVVGAVATIIAITNSVETPQEIKAPVGIFVGYLAAIFTGVVTGPGKTA
jgi:hypothetical protein